MAEAKVELKNEVDRFEKARLIGARALQLAMGAPPLIEVGESGLDPMKIAFVEFKKNVIPLAIVRE
ncbi:MAG: DNA-directed RNA polymerase subunit K [Candidatus Micrarchaeota archaeon]